MKLRDMPRELLLVTLAMIITNTAGSMYYPLLPLYLESLGASVQQVGLYFTINTILALCFRILGGWISDNVGRLPTIAFGGVLGLGAMIGFTLAPTWGWAFTGALLGSMGTSLVGPSFQAYTAEQAPEDSVSSTFGLVNGLFLVCMVIGPLVGGFMVDHYGYRTMLWTATSIFAVATVMRVWMARGLPLEVHRLRPAVLIRDVRGLLALLLGGGLLLSLFLVDGLADAGNQVAFPFVPKYMTEIGGLSETAYGGLMALMSLVSAAAMWPGGIFADRYGERWSIALGMIVLAGVWGVIIAYPVAGMFVLAMVLGGVGQAFIGPAFSSLVSKAVPRESLGITWGVFWTALGVLAIPAPYIGGLLYEHIAPEAAFVTAAVGALLTAPLAVRWLRLPGEKAAEAEAGIAASPPPTPTADMPRS
ncbi:MAG: MFS transporter [Anaerolineae bacterium]|nr:MFS transporter [Anaerolineae bacterium]